MDNEKKTLTRAQLKELYDAFECRQWRTYIMQLVTETPFNDNINITNFYIKLLKDQASDEMIDKVKSYGIIIEEEKWVRNPKTLTGLFLDGEANKNTYNKLTLLYNMTSWAEHYNKIDNFIPNWSASSQTKCGIYIRSQEVSIATKIALTSELLFSVAVSSKERATEMLAEFGSDIQQIKW